MFVVAGGAPLYLSTFDAVPWSSSSGTAVDYWDIANAGTNSLSHLNAVPANGTVLDTSGNNGVFVVAGGAPLYISNFNNVPGSASDGVAIDDRDVKNAATNSLAHLNAVPSNGTVVKGLPSDTYWSFEGGLRSPVGPLLTATVVDDAGLDVFPEAPVATVAAPAQNSGSAVTQASATETTSPARCVVPSLRKLTLPAAKRALNKAGCQLGTTSRPRRRHKEYVLRVVRQSVRQGTAHPQRFRVNVTLKWMRRQPPAIVRSTANRPGPCSRPVTG